MKYFKLTLFVLLPLLTYFSCSSPSLYPEGLSPEESMATFQLDEQFRVEIFAAEPHVQDPVSMVFDEIGKIYVVEMPDYPYAPEDGSGNGKVKQLIDRDGDGVIDDHLVFAEGILDATSVHPWKGGLLVTAAPHIWYMKDTNGDGRADQKEKYFSGFFDNNQEAQITNLRFNIDNWIYALNHGQAGHITSSKHPEAEALPLSGSDFRFRLDTDEYERETGIGQFGQTFDAFGNRFFTQNTTHISQMVLPWRYQHRHLEKSIKKGSVNISDHDLVMFQKTEAPHWRKVRSARRQKQYDAQNTGRVEHVDGHFSGASGGTYYGASLFPTPYRGSIFTGEVFGNLVHRDVLESPIDAVHFTAKRAPGETSKEFLASTDPWFRPANFSVGPDGALYIVDYYRQHIETPLSIPEDLKEDMDFAAGMDRGRIFRIVPKSSTKAYAPVTIPKDKAGLLGWLSHGDQWYRLQAQRVLIEKGQVSWSDDVRTIFEQTSSPETKVHCLYLLQAWGGLDADLVNLALEHNHPEVRRHAAQLAENFTGSMAQLIQATKDQQLAVALQATMSLGAFPSDQTTSVFATLLSAHYNNPWLRDAALASSAGSLIGILRELNTRSFFREPQAEKSALLVQIAGIIGSRNAGTDILTLIADLNNYPPESHQAVLTDLVDGIGSSKKPISYEIKSALERVLKKLESESAQELREKVDKLEI